MTEIYHATEDATREGLLALWIEVPEGSMRDEIWEDLIKLDRKCCREELLSLRDELNKLLSLQKTKNATFK